MSLSEAHNFSGESLAHFAQVINNINVGVWEYNTVTKKTLWSAGLYAVLGYQPGEIESSYSNFFENILYYDDKKAFLRSTDEYGKSISPTSHIRLLTKQHGYQWFESTSKKHDNDQGTIFYGILNNINNYKIAQLKAEHTGFLFAETGRIAKIGVLEVDIATMGLTLSKDIYDIFELQGEVKLSINEIVSFFEPPYRPLINSAIENAVNHCRPYDLELLLRTSKNNLVWIRTKGVPIIDDYGKCKTIRGILQDIDPIKKQGITMQSSINLLDDQNKRLQNFAYIVSHNLRSHAGNLKFMVNLYQDSNTGDDHEEIFSHIKTISESLNSTIGHLDEIVKMQTEIGKERRLVDFEVIFNHVIATLRANIEAEKATITANFSACPQINYIPAYLESIIQNFLTNALKYRHPDRPPVISCSTLREENSIYLIFEDNGLGIDLAKYGKDLFGLYKTFHQNKDSKGIGLFITRNQIEALGGSIKVESVVDKGTKFIVRLV